MRSDIVNGTLGVGYIMNNLAYLREQDEQREVADIEKVVRIEGHINHSEHIVTERLNKLAETRLANRLLRKIKGH
ncbi:hypothetical protein D3C86_1975660 [compost metagenome]